MNKKLEHILPNLEKGVIALIFFFVILNYIVTDAGDTFSIIIVVLQTALISIYFMPLQVKMYALLWTAFLLGIAGIFISFGNPFLNFVVSIAGYVAFGIIVLVKTLQFSFRTKNFELLNFIMGFLLILQAFLPFISKQQEVLTFYSFALSFSIGTIIYNDNLWHRYHPDERNIMKYILVVFLVAVLQSSFKYVNI